MLFLTLSSDQSNYTKTENELQWVFHNFDLGCHDLVGLSSVFIDFVPIGTEQESKIDVCTNLIDRNYFNETGILFTISGRKTSKIIRTNIEFWKLDTRKPKNVTFTFRHAKVNNLKNLTITLAFAKNPNAP